MKETSGFSYRKRINKRRQSKHNVPLFFFFLFFLKIINKLIILKVNNLLQIQLQIVFNYDISITNLLLQNYLQVKKNTTQ